MFLDSHAKKHYLLLDGAQHVDIQKLIYHFQDEASFKPIYYGTKFDSVLSISPCLIEVDIHSKILHWFYENNDHKKIGIYISSDHSFEYIFFHLQSLILAIVDNKEVLFRFYDPYVLCCCYYSFSLIEIERLLGPSHIWKWIDINKEDSWITLKREKEQNSVLSFNKYKMLYDVPFVISESILNTYCTKKDEEFIKKMYIYFQNKGFKFDILNFTKTAQRSIAQGRQYGLTYESSLTLFTLFWITVSPEFHLYPEIHEIFENKNLHQLEKIEMVSDAI